MSKDQDRSRVEFDHDPRAAAPSKQGERGGCWYDGNLYPEGTEGTDIKSGKTYRCVRGRWEPANGD